LVNLQGIEQINLFKRLSRHLSIRLRLTRTKPITNNFRVNVAELPVLQMRVIRAIMISDRDCCINLRNWVLDLIGSLSLSTIVWCKGHESVNPRLNLTPAMILTFLGRIAQLLKWAGIMVTTKQLLLHFTSNSLKLNPSTNTFSTKLKLSGLPSKTNWKS
jgi:hypothetical protein